METRLCRVAASVPLFAALLSCSHAAQEALPATVPSAPLASQTSQAPAPPIAGTATAFASVDEYKILAAQRVMRYNPEQTFSGKLPAMLPAIVVLRITIDHSGRITDVFVQRPPAYDEGESEIAVASMRRAGVLPRPWNLAQGPGRTLSYSETFLFNADMRFQLRTLAPIQGAD